MKIVIYEAVGIDAVALEKIVGKPVRTVPQILADDVPIGGYSELATLSVTL
ncbi:hypothetical protein [Klebsiella pneumoniae]|uniref:hypothetical protein n=1 Tax=Klebsiella pneumoniae TaxID=573 RepID=UPI0009F08125|nr:hypothetical protein [Klebsiella pneumoniae]HCI5975477.1 hypothetical protein [Klebsiella quasipneumoniae subsp. similipneumoniae]MBC4892320.1 hypothetical protein [Klebsiella pneumoniae]MCM5740404.1 hypothetical protein [Klebsiella pneumoniae]MCM6021796.1 hypothetical protein [Klebsiella pneumoniae]MCP6252621.1 hypothetical protein [Klebsiella pneumoniae]